MKIIKKNIKLLIGIIIGILISGSAVVAETIIEANHIKYSNSKTEKTNVQDAIDELYELSESLKYDNTSFTAIILKNNKVINKEPTLTTSINNSNDESGLYKSTTTNSGSPTYYFRGNVENNYVNFAEFTWRIVRINEDGTIRIVMQDGINNNANIAFNSNYNNYSYMYYSNSEIRPVLENWYQRNIGEKSNIAKNIATGSYYCEQAKVKYSGDYTSENANMIVYSSYTPDFKCVTDGNGKGVVNASVGLLTYDEVVYSGGYPYDKYYDYYLYNNTHFWTMSPAGISSGISNVWNTYYPEAFIHSNVPNLYSVRPVLILKSDTKILKGNGSKNNPYVLS